MLTLFIEIKKERLIHDGTISGPPVIHFVEEIQRDLKTLVCIQRMSILSAQAEDPLELFRIRPVGDVENSIHQHFRKLQQPRTQKHMKENTDSKNTTEQLQTISGLLNISSRYNINSYKKEYLSYTQHPNAKMMYLFGAINQLLETYPT